MWAHELSNDESVGGLRFTEFTVWVRLYSVLHTYIIVCDSDRLLLLLFSNKREKTLNGQ